MTIIITLCILLLLSYIFDISASKTKIPSIILLLILGFGIKLFTDFINFPMPELDSILPMLGKLGLILIVLEGALELEIDKSKLKLIGKSTLVAMIPILLISYLLALGFQYLEPVPLKQALINAIPLSIISSAIAIPSARNINKTEKEFVTYESSLSDIFGVIVFNFILKNEIINAETYGRFFLELIIMFVISIIATLILSIFIAKIKHHIKFLPIILSIVLIYSIAYEFNLPALVFILIFGLTLNNLDNFKFLNKIKGLNPYVLDKEVEKFSEITNEFAFLIRSLFFLLFGFLIELEDMINIQTLPIAIAIVILIFVIRALLLVIFRLKISPLLFIAPRGLITILLFIYIPSEYGMNLVNNALLIQVILICAFIMMFGLMLSDNNKEIVKEEINKESISTKIDDTNNEIV